MDAEAHRRRRSEKHARDSPARRGGDLHAPPTQSHLLLIVDVMTPYHLTVSTAAPCQPAAGSCHRRIAACTPIRSSHLDTKTNAAALHAFAPMQFALWGAKLC